MFTGCAILAQGKNENNLFCEESYASLAQPLCQTGTAEMFLQAIQTTDIERIRLSTIANECKTRRNPNNPDKPKKTNASQKTTASGR